MKIARRETEVKIWERRKSNQDVEKSLKRRRKARQAQLREVAKSNDTAMHGREIERGREGILNTHKPTQLISSELK